MRQCVEISQSVAIVAGLRAAARAIGARVGSDIVRARGVTLGARSAPLATLCIGALGIRTVAAGAGPIL